MSNDGNNDKNIINQNYGKMPGSYLFTEIASRIKKFCELNPDAEIIRLGIGDVTRPLPVSVAKAMHEAVEEMSKVETFKGYGPENGYEFLRAAISENEYKKRGVSIESNEIFVSDGSKCDCANFIELFSDDVKIAVCDPVYPVYVDSNAMAGRAGDYDSKTGRWSNICYMPCNEENNFLPRIPESKDIIPNIIYLCSPNNPTGSVMGYDELKSWVDYANENNSIILFDGAYESFITGKYPRSIFEIPGAKECSVEFRSFSKTAGFTGVRCAYTVIPANLIRNGMNLNAMWSRRQSTSFNGVPYITQKAALAVYSDEGQKEIENNIRYYLKNAETIREGLKAAGFTVFGGENAPYIWLKTPSGMSSWEFFQDLLDRTQIVGTPGSGFGPMGEGYFRLSAFGDVEKTRLAMTRIKSAYN